MLLLSFVYAFFFLVLFIAAMMYIVGRIHSLLLRASSERNDIVRLKRLHCIEGSTFNVQRMKYDL